MFYLRSLLICFFILGIYTQGYASNVKENNPSHPVTINLNTATHESLETLKGVGPIKAKAIIDFRNKHGKFNSMSDLKKVKGFTQHTIDKLLKLNPERIKIELPSDSNG